MVSLVIDENAEKQIAAFKEGKDTEESLFINVVDENALPLRLTLELESLGGVFVSEFGQSILCKVLKTEHTQMFAKLEELAETNAPEGFEVKDFTKDEKFFLKLQVKDKKYRAEFDPQATPSAPEKIVKQGSLLQVECKPGVWLNFDSKKTGLFLKVDKIIIDGGKKRTRKR